MNDIKTSNGITSIGIVGLDYCGSTLMNNILGSLPECIGAGETHWIVDFEKKPTMTGRCKECYLDECPIFSEDLLMMLRKEETLQQKKWWDLIAQSADKRIVISGDKRPHNYEKLGIPDKLLYIVKDPRAHILSWCLRNYVSGEEKKKYHEGNVELKFDDDQLNFAIKVWIRETRKHIVWCLNTGKPMAAISLEHFVQNSNDNLKKLSDWMGAEFDESALNFWESNLHYIGSNHSVKRTKKESYFYKKITLDTRWKSLLTSHQIQLMTSNSEIYNQLKKLEPYLIGEIPFIENAN